MRFMRYVARAVAVVLMGADVFGLAGCAQPAPSDSQAQALDRQLNDSARGIDTLLGDIARAGGISAVAPRAGVVSSTGDFMTVRWEGDAAEVLRKIAQARGLSFAQAGRPVPLPVAIDARNTDVVSVLENIGTQVGGRADVVLKTSALELRYRDQ